MEFEVEEIKSKYSKMCLDLKFYKFKWLTPPKTPLGPDWDFEPVCMPETHRKYAKLIRSFDIRSDDTFVLGFPKSGTSWLQEMIWLLCNDLNYTKAKKMSQMFRFPLLELASLMPIEQSISVLLHQMDKFPSPRYFKSHLPVSMLPEKMWSVKPKIIHIQRDPKDAAVSLYHHYKNLHGYLGSKDDFFNLYLEGNVYFGPLVNHAMEFQQLRNELNIHFITYTEMKRDLKAVIKSTAEFLEKSITTEQINDLYQYLQPETMRCNNSCNQEDLMFISSSVYQAEFDPSFKFIRKAKTDTYREEMSQDFIDKFEENIEKKIDRLSFKQEIIGNRFTCNFSRDRC